MANRTGGPQGHQLGEVTLTEVHRIQWDAAELCYGWLTEWEDVEIDNSLELDRLQSHLLTVAAAIHSASAELELMSQRSTEA